MLARHPRIAKRVAGLSEASEEILASLLGAMICHDDTDRVTLFAKATTELLELCEEFFRHVSPLVRARPAMRA